MSTRAGVAPGLQATILGGGSGAGAWAGWAVGWAAGWAGWAAGWAEPVACCNPQPVVVHQLLLSNSVPPPADATSRPTNRGLFATSCGGATLPAVRNRAHDRLTLAAPTRRQSLDGFAQGRLGPAAVPSLSPPQGGCVIRFIPGGAVDFFSRHPAQPAEKARRLPLVPRTLVVPHDGSWRLASSRMAAVFPPPARRRKFISLPTSDLWPPNEALSGRGMEIAK